MTGTLPADAIGLRDCAAPFGGVVLLGVRYASDAGSIWFALDFEGPEVELREVQYYVSPNDSFPDPSLIREWRPVLMAAADSARWHELEVADENIFLHAILNGDFELGGNFGRYRQYLEWLLANATLLRIVTAAAELNKGAEPEQN